MHQSEQDTTASSCCRKSRVDNVQQLLGESSAARKTVQALNVYIGEKGKVWNHDKNTPLLMDLNERAS